LVKEAKGVVCITAGNRCECRFVALVLMWVRQAPQHRIEVDCQQACAADEHAVDVGQCGDLRQIIRGDRPAEEDADIRALPHPRARQQGSKVLVHLRDLIGAWQISAVVRRSPAVATIPAQAKLRDKLPTI